MHPQDSFQGSICSDERDSWSLQIAFVPECITGGAPRIPCEVGRTIVESVEARVLIYEILYVRRQMEGIDSVVILRIVDVLLVPDFSAAREHVLLQHLQRLRESNVRQEAAVRESGAPEARNTIRYDKRGKRSISLKGLCFDDAEHWQTFRLGGNGNTRGAAQIFNQMQHAYRNAVHSIVEVEVAQILVLTAGECEPVIRIRGIRVWRIIESELFGKQERCVRTRSDDAYRLAIGEGVCGAVGHGYGGYMIRQAEAEGGGSILPTVGKGIAAQLGQRLGEGDVRQGSALVESI